MNGSPPAEKHLLPDWVRYCGWVFLVGELPFVGQMVYESTFLTCRNGPQMVGFSIAHGSHNLILFTVLFVPLSLVWLVATLILGLFRKFRFSNQEWSLLVVAAASLSLLPIPYPWWERFDVAICGPGSHGSQFLNDAAVYGDLRLVRNLVAKRYDVNHESEGGVTPLSAGVMGGKQEVVRFVLSKGANVNAHSSLAGQTPLMDAAETGNLEMLKLLLDHGAEPCATNRDGVNALGVAQKYRRQAAVEYLSAHYNCPPAPPPPPSTCANETSATCVEVH
jgi:hypothetical protein